MLRIGRCKLVLLANLLVLCFVVVGSAGEPGSRGLVSPQLLEHAGLEVVWANELPMGKRESLERLFMMGDRIYALSDENYIVSLNRENGDVMFNRPLAPAGFPVIGLELYKNGLFSIVGNRLVEINPQSGTELSSGRLGFNVVGPAARNSSHYYLAGADKRMHVLRAEDKVQVFDVAAENDSMITSIVADEKFVVFVSDAGTCVSMMPDKREPIWKFRAADAVVGPIVRDGQWLFVASKDTNVYKINVITGDFVWKYRAGAVLDRGPRVTRGVVYQYVRGKGLSAIDKKSGELLWRLAEGDDLLAQVDGKAYVITNVGTLAVMDNNKAKMVYSVNFAGVSKYVSNTTASKLYIADKAGRIACLKVIE